MESGSKEVSLKSRPREQHNNALLWQQMTRRYLIDRANAIRQEPQSPTSTTYRREFTTDPRPTEPVDVLQFPLYGRRAGGETRVVGTGSFNGAVAISFWNCNDVPNANWTFKQFHPLTKPHGECLDEQFR